VGEKEEPVFSLRIITAKGKWERHREGAETLILNANSGNGK
jgi:hypothetical protein